MAKLAVLISSPNSPTTHVSSAAPPLPDSFPFPADFAGTSGPTHGRWFDWRKPRSRASCSRVSGTKEPRATMLRINSPESQRPAHPPRRRQKPPRLFRRHTSPRAPAWLSRSCLRLGSAEIAVGGLPGETTREVRTRRSWANCVARKVSSKRHGRKLVRLEEACGGGGGDGVLLIHREGGREE